MEQIIGVAGYWLTVIAVFLFLAAVIDKSNKKGK